MDARQAQKVGEHLRDTMQVFFMNESADENRDAVKVTFQGSTTTGKKRAFLFHIKVAKYLPFNTKAMAQEICKIVPNIAVIEQNVFFFSRSITFVGKELGKTGTYEFDFVQVTP